eukprot:576628-Amphidinium_carterae.2
MAIQVMQDCGGHLLASKLQLPPALYLARRNYSHACMDSPEAALNKCNATRTGPQMRHPNRMYTIVAQTRVPLLPLPSYCAN